MEVTGLVLPPMPTPRGEVEVAKAQGADKTGDQGIIQKLSRSDPAIVEADEMPTYTPDGLKPAGKSASAGISIKV